MGDIITILVVEDEFVTGLEIQSRLSDHGFLVPEIVDTGEDAIIKADTLHPDLVIMDITLKGPMTGIEAANHIREKFNIPVIYLTAHSDDVTIKNAVISEPFGYLIKPLEERALLTSIRMALYKHSMEKALSDSEKRYRTISELAEDPIFIINPDYSIAYVNRYARDFFSIHSESKKQVSITSAFPPEMVSRLIEQIKTVIDYGHHLRDTHHFYWNESEYWLDISIVPIVSDEVVIQVIGLSRDISAMVRIEKEIEKKGIVQIEKNMEQFQILNDRIRNPLSIIMSLASLNDCKENDEIIEQVKKIDLLVTQLDQGWIQSEAVRSFLLKHYGMSTLIEK